MKARSVRTWLALPVTLMMALAMVGVTAVAASAVPTSGLSLAIDSGCGVSGELDGSARIVVSGRLDGETYLATFDGESKTFTVEESGWVNPSLTHGPIGGSYLGFAPGSHSVTVTGSEGDTITQTFEIGTCITPTLEVAPVCQDSETGVGGIAVTVTSPDVLGLFVEIDGYGAGFGEFDGTPGIWTFTDSYPPAGKTPLTAGAHTVGLTYLGSKSGEPFVTKPVTIEPCAETPGEPTPPPATETIPNTGGFVQGDTTAGSVLTAAPQWTIDGVISSYQWLRNGSPIVGATNEIYTLTDITPATVYAVRVTGRKTGYADTTITLAGRTIPKPGELVATIIPEEGAPNAGAVHLANDIRTADSDTQVPVFIKVNDETVYTAGMRYGGNGTWTFKYLAAGAVLTVVHDGATIASYTVPGTLPVPLPKPTTPESTTNPGATVEVSATGYAPGEQVDIWLHSTPVRLGALMADASGKIKGTFTIPSTTTPGAHHIVYKVGGITVGRTAITVVAATDAAAAGKSGAKALAATGSSADALGLGALAAMLALGGGVLLAVQRRRGVPAG